MYYTFISKKQIGVIFSNYKKGNINITEEQIKWLYNTCSEVKCFKNNMNFESVLQTVKNAIDCLFKNDYKEAEEKLINAYKFYNAIYN